jgi:phage terminase small subunit
MLTPSQELFFQATLRGEKPEQAAISAGLKSPKPSGFRMRKHPAIVAALAAVGISTAGVKPSKPGSSEEPIEVDLATVDIVETEDPKVFLTALMNCPKAGVKARLEAAKALLPFEHSKIGEKGKKATKAEGAAAAAAEGNKFGARAAPLRAVPK